MQTAEKLTIQMSRTIKAPREAVFRAWTEPETLRLWFHPAPTYTTPVADVDLRPGGRYRIVMRAADGADHAVSGTFREIQPPERLVFTWAWEDAVDEPETVVTVELVERGESTEVVLTHQGFATLERREQHTHGWTGCLEQLATQIGA